MLVLFPFLLLIQIWTNWLQFLQAILFLKEVYQLLHPLLNRMKSYWKNFLMASSPFFLNQVLHLCLARNFLLFWSLHQEFFDLILILFQLFIVFRQSSSSLPSFYWDQIHHQSINLFSLFYLPQLSFLVILAISYAFWKLLQLFFESIFFFTLIHSPSWVFLQAIFVFIFQLFSFFLLLSTLFPFYSSQKVPSIFKKL